MAMAAGCCRRKVIKKADVAENPKVFDHVGLLVNEPPGEPGCSLFSHPITFKAAAPRIPMHFGSVDYSIVQHAPGNTSRISRRLRICYHVSRFPGRQ
jgi:hypothetical protein